MNNTVSVARVTEDFIEFSNGQQLSSYHSSDCCEHHYLSFSDVSLEDFDGMLFNLTGDDFFERVDGYGIRLRPVSGGWPVSIPGYGFNNGYYSEHLDLVLSGGGLPERTFDVTECQEVSG